MKKETPSFLKILMILVMSLFCWHNASAEDSNPFLYYMQIVMKDGTQQDILLNELPVVTFEKSTLIISTTQSEITYSDISRITFSEKINNTPTSLSELNDPASSGKPLMRVYDDKVVFSRLGGKSRVNVFMLRGQLVYASSNSNGDEISVDWSSFSPGVYIFQVNQHSFKLIKK